MNEVKFQVSPVVGTIAANFDEVAKEFEERMSQYDGIVFTEDKKADAKKVVADLRKDKKEITDEKLLIHIVRIPARIRRMHERCGRRTYRPCS